MLDPKTAGCRGKLFGMVAFIFASGMLAGAFTMSLVERYYWLRPKPSVLSEAGKAMAVQHFCRELALNESQTKAIENILDEFIMQQADLLARYRSTRLSGHDRILEILNEDQRRRFKKILGELQNQRKD